MICSGLVNGTNTFVLVAINNDRPHPYLRKYNTCKLHHWLPSEYDNEDCFDTDMFGFIDKTVAEKNRPKGKGDKHSR